MSTLLPRASHMADLVRAQLPRIHPGGVPIVVGLATGTTAASTLLHATGLHAAARSARRWGTMATVSTALFFRVPVRVPPPPASSGEPAPVVAPADGVIAQITRATPPTETGLASTPRPRISIFLSLIDAHVQFVPMTGTVTSVHYHPGRFLSADLDKASEANERNSVVIRSGHGDDLVVTQIAGLIARRIVCDLSGGQNVTTGQVYGLIRFGSRLDTYLPAGAEPCVRVGQRAVGGETVLATVPPTRQGTPPTTSPTPPPTPQPGAPQPGAPQ